MKYNIVLFILLIFFAGCSKQLYVKEKNYDEALNSFVNSCKSSKTLNIYGELCQRAKKSSNSKKFFSNNFKMQKLKTNDKALLTGYYEASLKGSLIKKEPYVYPVYETPNDLIVVDLDEQYKSLKGMRLRGRLENGKIIPYYERKEIVGKKLDANIICYTDSKIDLFFLEVQGSGRVLLDNGESIFVGYNNQNGHPYSSIGKYLIAQGEIPKDKISLQSIKKWFEQNPSRVDEVLNQNKSVVFFKQSNKPATGSLGVELTPNRSIAVDTRYIKLGTLLYLRTKDMDRFVMAEDTGGAIKGRVRADMFLGFGDEAADMAGSMIEPLQLWKLVPKIKVKDK